MKTLEQWVGMTVTVVLRSTIAVSITATLKEIDRDGVLLELPHGVSYVPMSSVLHISLEPQ